MNISISISGVAGDIIFLTSAAMGDTVSAFLHRIKLSYIETIGEKDVGRVLPPPEGLRVHFPRSKF